MEEKILKTIVISGTGFYAPSEVITNEELVLLGIEIVEKKNDGDRKLKIPAESINKYFSIIKEKLL